jgi:putative holliday junction resolvase
VVRVLALDHGSARCGCAISDPSGTLAKPLEAIERPDTKKGLAAVARLVGDQGAERVVVGLPLSLTGEDSAQTRETRAFAARLGDALAVPVELYDERFTTKLAARTGGTGSLDSRAAATLLDEWLSLPIREENPPA